MQCLPYLFKGQSSLLADFPYLRRRKEMGDVYTQAKAKGGAIS